MPATTIIAQPSVMMPAYNPIKYIIDNAYKNEPGFRYIFTVYPATNATPIAQYKTLPVFGTGYGEQDISRLMQSLVTWKFAVEQVNESWYQYDIRFGYEYTANIQYTASLTIDGLNTNITSSTAHGFVVGDQISITQAFGGIAANPVLEGLHTVISVTDANNFTVNVLWSTITDATINGTVTYADLRKTILIDDVVLSQLEVFNGAYSLGIYAQGLFPSTEYNTTLTPSNALTSLVGNTQASAASIATGQLYYLMVRTYSIDTYDITYFDWDDYQLTSSIVASATDGLYNFLVTTDVPSEPPITQNFYVSIKGGSAEIKYYFKYDNRCVINEDYLYYLDRMGSFQSFAFQLKTYEKGQITREMYNQHVDGQVVDGEWLYSSDAMGSKTYNINVSNTLDLNTNWMDQYDADRFQELLTSPQVFYYNGTEYRACTIDSTSFENFRQRNKNLIKHSVTIKLALNTPING
jgi:hypothetical protein